MVKVGLLAMKFISFLNSYSEFFWFLSLKKSVKPNPCRKHICNIGVLILNSCIINLNNCNTIPEITIIYQRTQTIIYEPIKRSFVSSSTRETTASSLPINQLTLKTKITNVTNISLTGNHLFDLITSHMD